MEFRDKKIFTGQVFQVPNHIERVDSNGGHAWQVRYGRPWKSFSDGSSDGTGADRALREAIDELAKRINRLPAPTGARLEPLQSKRSGLPVGISGPIARYQKKMKVPYYELQVTWPVVGGKPKNSKVYIGTENTFTDEKIAKREKNMKKYQTESNKLKRHNAEQAGIVRSK
jgi:hypothetical protein